MKTKTNRRGLMTTSTFSTALFSTLLVPTLFGGAHAQEAADKAAEAKKEPEATEVVIVGSRIRKNTFNSASPITIITRDETTAAGLSSTSEVLQSTTVTGGGEQINNAFGGFVTNGGPGASTVGLRGLGPGRSLIMINGRRVAPAGSRGSVGSADLNVLPSAMVGRTEVLRDGASAIYGSDAIGGVINIITRNVTGLTLEVQHNQPTAHGGERTRISAVAGKTWDRLSVQGSIEYYESQELTYGDRSWTQCPTNMLVDPATGATLDYIDPLTKSPRCFPLDNGGTTLNTLGTPLFAGVGHPDAPGSAGRFNRWRPNSAVTTGLSGYEGVSGGSLDVRDTFAPFMLERSLLSPFKTTTAFGQFTYQLPEFANSEIYGEALIHKRLSSQTGNRQLTLDYATGSLAIPAAISAIPGTFLSSSEVVPGPIKARAFIGWGTTKSRQEVDFYKLVTGIRGDFSFLEGWKYDLSAQYSKSDAMYMFPSFITSRVKAASAVAAPVAGVPSSLIVTNPAGQKYTCVENNLNPTNASCVPIPVLDSKTIAGIYPDNFKSYIFQDVPSNTLYSEFTLIGSMNGKVLTLPAGDVKGAIGFEYRDASINDQPNELSVKGDLYNLTSATPTVGEDSVIEAFAELNIPVFKELPFIRKLDVELAGRFTEYKSYGGDTTYKAGILYEPFSFLTLRASQGTSYRAPALFEQFLGATSGFSSSANDPCNNWDAPNVNPNRAANCKSLGLPPGWGVGSGNNQSIKVITAGGAAQNLSAETSENSTIGFVFQPKFLSKAIFGDLAIAIDKFDIVIDNGVSRAGSGFLMSQCYNSPGFSSPFCAYTERNSANNALTVYDSYTNISSQTVKGYDYTVRWEKAFGKLKVLVNASATKYDEQGAKSRPDTALIDYNGTLNTPDITGDINARFTYDKWRVNYGIDWAGGSESYTFNRIDRATSIRDLDVEGYQLHRVSGAYYADTWTATVGVRNLFDEEPPVISSGVENLVGNAPLYSGYDYRGREVFVTISKKF